MTRRSQRLFSFFKQKFSTFVLFPKVSHTMPVFFEGSFQIRLSEACSGQKDRQQRHTHWGYL